MYCDVIELLLFALSLVRIRCTFTALSKEGYTIPIDSKISAAGTRETWVLIVLYKIQTPMTNFAIEVP